MKKTIYHKSLILLIFLLTLTVYADELDDGNSYYLQENWTQASAKYAEAEELMPDRPEVYLNMGNVLYKQAIKNLEDQGAILKEQIESGVMTDQAQLQQAGGQIMQELKNALEAAIAEYDKAEEVAGRILIDQEEILANQLIAAARNNKGNCQYKMQQLEEAINAYREALRVNPEDDDAKYNLYRLKELLESQLQQQQMQQQQQQGEQGQQQQQSQQNQGEQQEQNADQQENQQPQDQQDQQDPQETPEIPEEDMTNQQMEHYLRSAREKENRNRQENIRRQLEQDHPHTQPEFDY